MLEKWGLIIHWDTPNDCYTASVPEMLACVGKGATRQEALEALEQEVEHWLKTSRELGYSSTASETQTQVLPTPDAQSGSLNSSEQKRKKSNSGSVETQKAEGKLEIRNSYTSWGLNIAVARNQPVIILDGQGDIKNCSLLKQACDDIFALGQRRLVVDMTRLVYLDSSILGVLVNALKKFRSVDGFVCLVRSKEPNIDRLLAITRFDSIFQMADNLEEALKKLESL